MSQDHAAGKPLAGIRILDFTRVLAGPYCAMLLGDLGADVVKVESPGEGDLTRRQGPPFHHGMGMTYLAANRNKRSIALDLRSDDGRRVARELAGRADVVLENFRPGVMRKLGLDYESLAPDHPGLIYASISGMGASGPDRDVGAFDVTIQAIGGYMSITGEPDGAPVKLGNSAMDIVAGTNCHAAVLAALLHRAATGKGQKIETSLLESQVAFLANAALEYLVAGSVPRRWGSEHSQQVPYKAFRTADGWLVIGAGFQGLFERLAQALGREDWISDPRYASLPARVEHRRSLYAELDPIVRRHTTVELIALLEPAGIPCAPVNDIRQVFEHRQVKHREMVVPLQHPVYGALPQLGAAAKFSGFDITAGWTPPPLLGEHGEQVLHDWLE
ncbi:CaiB/BaiF CoA-transferase family protein [Pigmentiphaga soli]|uniref:CaiB/BaiF CoA-transferase family protein n=1 Tax=Pigmentiphaga soli TaxID=1007095 RepID=A0ABP8GKQ9_9BURK